jgi:hypothetical protein
MLREWFQRHMLRIFEMWLKSEVLLEIAIHQPCLTRHLLPLREEIILLGLMMGLDPAAPDPTQHEKVGDIVGAVNVGSLERDAVHPADDGIVNMDHFLRDVDSSVLVLQIARKSKHRALYFTFMSFVLFIWRLFHVSMPPCLTAACEDGEGKVVNNTYHRAQLGGSRQERPGLIGPWLRWRRY